MPPLRDTASILVQFFSKWNRCHIITNRSLRVSKFEKGPLNTFWVTGFTRTNVLCSYFFFPLLPLSTADIILVGFVTKFQNFSSAPACKVWSKKNAQNIFSVRGWCVWAALLFALTMWQCFTFAAVFLKTWLVPDLTMISSIPYNVFATPKDWSQNLVYFQSKEYNSNYTEYKKLQNFFSKPIGLN